MSSFFSSEITFMQTSGFYNMKSYILTKGRNFKTFLKENYAFDLDMCY